MQLWHEIHAEAAGKFRGAAVMIGNFDGLHLGHQALLERASGCPGPKVVITFSPHPLQVLQPEREVKLLFPREDLSEQLPRFGVDLLAILNFTREFAGQSAEEFLEAYVARPFAPADLIAGYDFHFGRARQGSEHLLRTWSARAGARLHVVPPLRLDGEVVSSRRIRELVTAGRVGEAARFLGRPFYLRGEVGRGAGRGEALGFPTLNQDVRGETLPAQGVYATRLRLDGESRPAVTNIGVNPTFGAGGEVKVETHVLDGPCEARGRVIDVDFIARLRPEMRFAGTEDLKKQIQSDILKAREILTAK